MDLAVISLFVAGVLAGLLIAWVVRLARERRRRPHDLDRLVTEREDARRRARAAVAAAEQARAEAAHDRATADLAEERLRAARASIADITERIRHLSLLRSVELGDRGAAEPVGSTGRAAPSSAEHEQARDRLEGERRELRRRLAEQAVDLDDLRRGPTSRAVNDPRFRAALDELADLWDEHRTVRVMPPVIDLTDPSAADRPALGGDEVAPSAAPGEEAC